MRLPKNIEMMIMGGLTSSESSANCTFKVSSAITFIAKGSKILPMPRICYEKKRRTASTSEMACWINSPVLCLS